MLAAEFLNAFTRKHINALKKEPSEQFKTNYLALLIMVNYHTGEFDKTKDLDRSLRWMFQLAPTFYCDLFANKTFTHRLLEDEVLKRYYCKTCE